MDMKRKYTKHIENCPIAKVPPYTVAFLLNYSNSLRISEIRGIEFEINLN